MQFFWKKKKIEKTSTLYTYIDTLEDLSILNKELIEKPFLGVDTEFRRTTKDNMKLALLQINDGEEIYLIDTVLIKKPEDNCKFLFSESVTKIFHSCKEDLEAIHSWTGEVVVNLFDTQLANAFLDGDYSIGYQGLVQDKLGIKLDKKETRSNWIKRPLSESQLNYAATDVEFLINIYLDQKRELIESDKLDWHKEDLQLLISSIFNSSEHFEEVSSILTKKEEKELLFKFNEIVIKLAYENAIHPTLFFSKKSQKDFIRLALCYGLKEASEEISRWRRDLIQKPLEEILADF